MVASAKWVAGPMAPLFFIANHGKCSFARDCQHSRHESIPKQLCSSLAKGLALSRMPYTCQRCNPDGCRLRERFTLRSIQESKCTSFALALGNTGQRRRALFNKCFVRQGLCTKDSCSTLILQHFHLIIGKSAAEPTKSCRSLACNPCV